MVKVHHGQLLATIYGSVMHTSSFKRWYPTLTLPGNLTLCLIKNIAQMDNIGLRTSCLATGPGNKQWVDLRHWVYLFIQYPQDKIIIDHPKNKGAFFMPIIVRSDKTTVSVATGQTIYWPVYISISNICNNVRCAHQNIVMLLGFLACPKCKFSLSFFTPHTYLNTV